MTLNFFTLSVALRHLRYGVGQSLLTIGVIAISVLLIVYAAVAALMFMAIVIPVAVSGLGVASRAGEVAVRKTEASLLADRILNENVATTNWTQALQTGTLRQGRREPRRGPFHPGPVRGLEDASVEPDGRHAAIRFPHERSQRRYFPFPRAGVFQLARSSVRYGRKSPARRRVRQSRRVWRRRN